MSNAPADALGKCPLLRLIIGMIQARRTVQISCSCSRQTAEDPRSGERSYTNTTTSFEMVGNSTR